MKELFTKMVRSKYSILYLILFIGALYMLQEKAIMPLVMSVVKSEVFFEKPVEENEPLGKLDVKTERTAYAWPIAVRRSRRMVIYQTIPSSLTKTMKPGPWAIASTWCVPAFALRIPKRDKSTSCTPAQCA